jgi:creatinine amidohydrolase
VKESLVPHNARPHVLHEATYRQALDLKPNLAVLPWGATEAHNWHLPHGTDTIEATHLAEASGERANSRGARCIILPTLPFGNNNTQLTQVATITMRSATQQMVLFDVADSLVRQGIDRLVLLNFHGGNEFKAMIRDVMLDLPIFIVQIHGYLMSQSLIKETLQESKLGHADEFETSLLLHLTPHLVAPLETAGEGTTTPSQLPKLSSTPGVWFPRDWQALSPDTGDGKPHAATPEKGQKLFESAVETLSGILVELSQAKEGQFPFTIRRWPAGLQSSGTGS